MPRRRALPDPRYAIRHPDGSYYARWSSTGPAFGVSIDHARKFLTKVDAVREQGKDWKFDETEVVDALREALV